MGDLHYGLKSGGTLCPVFSRMREQADIVVLCGDLTDHGLPAEATVLAHDLHEHLRLPVVGVLGNHDVESGRQNEVAAILSDAGVVLLDGEPWEIQGVGFTGVKGFCGGFGRAMLEPWGESIIKQFVQEAVDETRKLELGMAKLRVERRVALLHYAPIHDTVVGEPPEIVPYLGSSRLAEPINTFGASLVVHGHAHFGRPEGRTATGVPVHNCALPLRRSIDSAHPYALLEV